MIKKMINTINGYKIYELRYKSDINKIVGYDVIGSPYKDEWFGILSWSYTTLNEAEKRAKSAQKRG